MKNLWNLWVKLVSGLPMIARWSFAKELLRRSRYIAASGNPSKLEVGNGLGEHRFRPADTSFLDAEEVYLSPKTVCLEPNKPEDTWLVGPSCLPISSRGVLLESAMFRSRERSHSWITNYTDWMSLFILLASQNGIKLRRFRGEPEWNRTVSLVSPWATQFGHFLTEEVPKVLFAQRSNSNQSAMFVLERKVPKWKMELLDLLGVSEDQIIAPPRKGRAKRALFVPHQPVVPESLAEMRELVLGDVVRKGSVRLYVSRQNMSDRFLSEPSAVETLLQRFGFETVHPQEMSVGEQVKLFSQASAIVGCSGSGMLGMIWAPPEVKVMEFFGSRIFHGLNAMVADALGIEYTFLIGNPTGTSVRAESIQVDCEALINWLRAL